MDWLIVSNMISLIGLRKTLRLFDENEKYARNGKWSIARGGYDLYWELYYDNIPIVDCTEGFIKISISNENTIKLAERIVKAIKEEYSYCYKYSVSVNGIETNL